MLSSVNRQPLFKILLGCVLYLINFLKLVLGPQIIP